MASMSRDAVLLVARVKVNLMLKWMAG